MKTLTLKVTQNSFYYCSENGNKSSIHFTDEMNEDEANPGITEDDPYFLLAQRLANAPQVRVPLKEEGEVTTPGKTSITFSTISVFAMHIIRLKIHFYLFSTFGKYRRKKNMSNLQISCERHRRSCKIRSS